MRRAALLTLSLLAIGCGRSHYRQAADAQVYPILADRATAAGFATDRLHVESSSPSRHADPTDPDRSPRPPDDRVAAAYMARPNGIKGAKWPPEGLEAIEHPAWEASLPLNAQGQLELDANAGFELALLHSREYQTALERLYLAALALTLNRFEFETRWFLTNATDFSAASPGTFDGTSAAGTTSNVGFTRTFAAGGQLIADFANSFLLDFNNNGGTGVSSTFALNFVQPLLRNAGRRVRLETLTQAERDVLYAARDFYRFRKRFWADVTTLDAGHLSLLLQVQQIRNLQLNLEGQEQNLRLHEELFRGGKKSIVQVDQAFQAYQQAIAELKQSEAQREASFDAYKLQLGLPPRLPMVLDESALAPFVLVDPKLEILRGETDAYQKARNRDLDAPPLLDDLRSQHADLGKLAERFEPFLAAIDAEVSEWGKTIDPNSTEDAAVRARTSLATFRETLPDAVAELRKIRDGITTGRAALNAEKRKEGWEGLVGLTRRLLNIMDQTIAVQTQVRINRIALPEVPWKEADALAFAKTNRLDLMTRQAQVTDAWRKVEVAANGLKSDLNIVANASIGSTASANNVLDLATDEGQYGVGVRFDGPLNRRAERNAYRASQIAYQQSRRDYMELSDQVEQAVRNDLRQLELQRVNFEIARLTLISAARQLEAARQRILSAKEAAGDSSTLDILNALTSLLNARNALVGGYINYEQLRVQLLLDLEALRLDPHGYPSDDRSPPRAGGFAVDQLPAPGGRAPARLDLPKK